MVLLAFLLFSSISAAASHSSEENLVEFIGSIIGALVSILVFVIPRLFVIAIGTHYQLKWWLSSDDFLDKIWKGI